MTSADHLIRKARSEPAYAAVATWKQILETDPFNLEAVYSIAECLVETGKYSESIQYLNRLREVSVNLANKLEQRFRQGSYAMCDIANRYLEDGLIEQARSSFEQARELMPKNVDCYVGLGRVALHENNLELAERYFRFGLSIEQDNHFALLGMGDVRIESQPESAIDFFTRAIEISPTEPYSYYQRAKAFAKLGKIIESNSDLEQARRLRISNSHD